MSLKRKKLIKEVFYTWYNDDLRHNDNYWRMLLFRIRNPKFSSLSVTEKRNRIKSVA